MKSLLIMLSLLLLLSSCSISIQSSSDQSPEAPAQPTTDPVSPYKYIATAFVDTISRCTVNQSDGTLSNCVVVANSNPSFSIVFGVSIHGNYGYVTNYGTNTVSVCQIDLNGMWSSCMNAGVNGLSNPSSILFANNGLVYITNSLSNSITICTEIQGNGTLSNCHNATPSFNRPSDIVISGNDAYISSYAENRIYKCNVVANDLSSCNNLYPTSAFFCPQNLSLFQNHLYIANVCTDTVSICSISTDNCVSSMHFSDLPTGIKVENSRAYITLQLEGIIELCSINNTTGLFDHCAPATDDNFEGPTMGIF